MLIKNSGEIPSSEITGQGVYLNRRKFRAGAVLASVAAGRRVRDLILPKVAEEGNMIDSIHKSSFSTNERITEYKDVTTYNNYYEFSSDKGGSAALARDFRTRLPDMLVLLLLNCSEIDSRSYPKDQVLIGRLVLIG